MISHDTTGTFTREDGSEYNKITPAVPSKRCKGVVENLADVYGWIHTVKDENGIPHQVITLRAENDSVSGGNHFKYLVPQIELSYEALSEAVKEAIDLDEQNCGNSDFFTDERKVAAPEEVVYDFDELMETFQHIVVTLQEATGPVFATNWAPRIMETVEKYLGKGKKVNDMSRDQAEFLSLIVEDLTEQVGNGV